MNKVSPWMHPINMFGGPYYIDVSEPFNGLHIRLCEKSIRQLWRVPRGRSIRFIIVPKRTRYSHQFTMHSGTKRTYLTVNPHIWFYTPLKLRELLGANTRLLSKKLKFYVECEYYVEYEYNTDI